MTLIQFQDNSLTVKLSFSPEGCDIIGIFAVEVKAVNFFYECVNRITLINLWFHNNVNKSEEFSVKYIDECTYM